MAGAQLSFIDIFTCVQLKILFSNSYPDGNDGTDIYRGGGINGSYSIYPYGILISGVTAFCQFDSDGDWTVS